MRKVYVKVPGLELRIERYGVATDKVPVEVPDEVAAELAKHPHLRVEEETRVLPAGTYGKDELNAAIKKAGSPPKGGKKKEKEG